MSFFYRVCKYLVFILHSVTAYIFIFVKRVSKVIADRLVMFHLFSNVSENRMSSRYHSVMIQISDGSRTEYRVSLTQASFKVAAGYRTKNIWNQDCQRRNVHHQASRVEVASGLFYFQHVHL